MIKKIISLLSCLNGVSKRIEPHMIILAFVIVMPALTGTGMAWIFALLTLVVASRVVFVSLLRHSPSFSAIETIKNNEEVIEQIEEYNKRLKLKLSKLKKNKKQLKLTKMKGGDENA